MIVRVLSHDHYCDHYSCIDSPVPVLVLVRTPVLGLVHYIAVAVAEADHTLYQRHHLHHHIPTPVPALDSAEEADKAVKDETGEVGVNNRSKEHGYDSSEVEVLLAV